MIISATQVAENPKIAFLSILRFEFSVLGKYLSKVFKVKNQG